MELGEEMETVSAKEMLWHLPFAPSKVTIDGKVVPRASSSCPTAAWSLQSCSSCDELESVEFPGGYSH